MSQHMCQNHNDNNSPLLVLPLFYSKVTTTPIKMLVARMEGRRLVGG
jgi:hypothetical protein